MGIDLRKLIKVAPRLAISPYHLPSIAKAYEAVSESRAYHFFIHRMLRKLNENERHQLEKLTNEPIDMEYLKGLPAESFGFQYQAWMIRSRLNPSYYRDIYPEGAHVYEGRWMIERFPKTHDFHHTLLGASTSVPDEISLQVFNLLNFGELGGLFSLMGMGYLVARYRCSPKETIAKTLKCSWYALKLENLLKFPFELHYETKMDDLRKHFQIPIDGIISQSRPK